MPTAKWSTRTSISEQDVLQGTVGLREGLTIYTRLGNGPALLIALAGIAAGWALERRSSRRAATAVAATA